LFRVLAAFILCIVGAVTTALSILKEEEKDNLENILKVKDKI